MERIFVYLSLFLVLMLNAQNKKFHFITLNNENNKEIETDFYVDKIYDARQFNQNIGSAQKSIANLNVQINFENSLVDEFGSFLSKVYPKKDNKRSISIRINDVYLIESTSSNKETGYATVVFDVIEKIENKDFIVGSYSSTIESSGYDVTSKHAERLISAIKKCFDDYSLANSKFSSPIEFNPLVVIGTKNVQGPIKKGIYLSYTDVLNGNSLNVDNYTITKYQEGNCLLNNHTGRVENCYYGFSDGKSFYLNASRYSTVKYYLRTEILGDNYYIDEVNYHSTDFSFLKSQGISALVLFPDLNANTVPLVINRFNGAPVLLTNKYMVDLLTSDKELLKEYKKTSRGVLDKKKFYKQYYKYD
ncbi:hypothetical protein [Flavobacterium undicola]|uniref:hypothetical protein n=1 Tax=Flavobacterium undicola TaxID=1932779 RepID=UPI001377AA5D|nr:hypothetical protein [Flavobacterium undicola]MBA0882781.1 hypothetical protein [Flavobacterium undicola]